MHAHHQHYIAHELLKWTILTVLSLAFVLILSQFADGQPIEAQSAITGRTTVTPATLRSASQDATIAGTEDRGSDVPTARRIWEVLELHEDQMFEAAIDGWQELSLFACDEPWRAVAVGNAYLQMGDLENALCVLHESTEPENAVTHHLRGVVHWLNSRVATRNGKLYLAEEYQDHARMEFGKALVLASQVRLEDKLGLVLTKFVSTRAFGPSDTIFPRILLPPANPSVRDLLETLSLDDFVATSHIGLAEIGLEVGELLDVEGHLDDAAKVGRDMSDLYMVLGKAYEADGQSMAATRVFMKAMTGTNKTSSAINAIRNLRKANPLD